MAQRMATATQRATAATAASEPVRATRAAAASADDRDELPGIYEGVPPAYAYGGAEERALLRRVRRQARAIHTALDAMLRTFGPKPDMEVAFWVEDAMWLERRVGERLDGLAASPTRTRGKATPATARAKARERERGRAAARDQVSGSSPSATLMRATSRAL